MKNDLRDITILILSLTLFISFCSKKPDLKNDAVRTETITKIQKDTLIKRILLPRRIEVHRDTQRIYTNTHDTLLMHVDSIIYIDKYTDVVDESRGKVYSDSISFGEYGHILSTHIVNEDTLINYFVPKLRTNSVINNYYNKGLYIQGHTNGSLGLQYLNKSAAYGVGYDYYRKMPYLTLGYKIIK